VEVAEALGEARVSEGEEGADDGMDVRVEDARVEVGSRVEASECFGIFSFEVFFLLG